MAGLFSPTAPRQGQLEVLEVLDSADYHGFDDLPFNQISIRLGRPRYLHPALQSLVTAGYVERRQQSIVNARAQYTYLLTDKGRRYLDGLRERPGPQQQATSRTTGLAHNKVRVV